MQLIDICLDGIVKDHYSIHVSHQDSLVEITEKFDEIKLREIKILIEKMCNRSVFHNNRCLSTSMVFRTDA